VRARYVAFSPRGDLAAITCNDGAVWYYSLTRQKWRFTRPHEADVFTGQFSPDGRFLASSDSAGVVVLHSIAHVEKSIGTMGGGGD